MCFHLAFCTLFHDRSFIKLLSFLNMCKKWHLMQLQKLKLAFEITNNATHLCYDKSLHIMYLKINQINRKAKSQKTGSFSILCNYIKQIHFTPSAFICPPNWFIFVEQIFPVYQQPSAKVRRNIKRQMKVGKVSSPNAWGEHWP